MIALQPGLCSVTFRGLEPEAIIDLALEARLEGIEWAGDVHLPPGAFDRARDVRRQCDKAGLVIVSYGSYIRAPVDGLAAFETVLETALALGAPNIRLWPGWKGRDSKDYTTEARAETASSLKTMAARAAEAGLTVSLEYHPQSLTDNLASARALASAAAHPGLFFYWQPAPGLPLQEAKTELAAIGHEISHLHVFAWDAGKRRYPLSHQADYWREIFAALSPSRWPAKRYALLEFVEGDAPETFLKDAASLRALLTNSG